jgi:hypothetical protein
MACIVKIDNILWYRPTFSRGKKNGPAEAGPQFREREGLFLFTAID